MCVDLQNLAITGLTNKLFEQKTQNINDDNAVKQKFPQVILD